MPWLSSFAYSGGALFAILGGGAVAKHIASVYVPCIVISYLLVFQ